MALGCWSFPGPNLSRPWALGMAASLLCTCRCSSQLTLTPLGNRHSALSPLPETHIRGYQMAPGYSGFTHPNLDLSPPAAVSTSGP